MGTTPSTAVSQQTSTTRDEDVLVTHPLHSSSRSVMPKRSTLRLRVDYPSVMEHGEEKKALASPQDVAAVIDKLPRAVLRRLQPKLRKLGFDITFEKGGHRAVKLHKELTTVRGDEEMLSQFGGASLYLPLA